MNVNFYNFLENEEYDKALLSADIGLVSLAQKIKLRSCLENYLL